MALTYLKSAAKGDPPRYALLKQLIYEWAYLQTPLGPAGRLLYA